MSYINAMADKGQESNQHGLQTRTRDASTNDFVLEKSIFSNIFEKDIRRVFIYKKAERLAKAMHLVAPAFASSPPLQARMDAASIALIDAAILPPLQARTALSRELLALSSVLSIAQTTGLLSTMNAELIAREAHLLLQEVAAYEDPRVALPEVESFSELSRRASKESRASTPQTPHVQAPRSYKGHTQSVSRTSRRDIILDVLKSKEKSYIKDISSAVRGVSEKTIQRELQALIQSGEVVKQGERRWTLYSIKGV